MTTTYDSWLTTLPGPPHVNHLDTYPTGYVCRCGGDVWTWDIDALGWYCDDCGDWLDSGAYALLSPEQQREEAMLDRCDL